MLRILNLEDTPDDSWLLQRYLTQAGVPCELRREQTAADFEKALLEGTWDIILADYFLPGFTAVDALRIVRQCSSDVPFIVVSGAVGEQAAVNVLREGAADYVMKDSLARLVPAINRGLHETEQRRLRQAAEGALRESEMRLRGILDNSPNAVFMKDLDSRYVLVNRCYENLLGVSDAEIRGKTDGELFPAEYAAMYAENERRVKESSGPMQFEEQMPLRDGVHTRLANRFPLFDAAGAPEGVCTICTDITERKKQEDALRHAEKLAAAGRLAASIAHEVNNPLEGMTNLVYLLQQQPELSEHSRSLLDMTEQELNRVSHIARQTLAFYRESTSPERVNLQDIFAGLRVLYGNKIRQRELDVSIAGEGCAEVVAGEMRQAFSNLLSNAIDASPRGRRIQVRIRDTRDWERGESAAVRVTIGDKGPGIPRENLSKIFEAFFTTKTDGTGTGLGLWVTRSILEKHGAKVEIRTSVKPGASGTAISVLIPKQITKD